MSERLLEALSQLRSSLFPGRRETWKGGVFRHPFVSIVFKDLGDVPYPSA